MAPPHGGAACSARVFGRRGGAGVPGQARPRSWTGLSNPGGLRGLPPRGWLAEEMSKALGVGRSWRRNRPGAGGATIALGGPLAHFPADGYTLFNATHHSINKAPCTRSSPYDPDTGLRRDYGAVATGPLVICVKNGVLRSRNLRELNRVSRPRPQSRQALQRQLRQTAPRRTLGRGRFHVGGRPCSSPTRCSSKGRAGRLCAIDHRRRQPTWMFSPTPPL